MVRDPCQVRRPHCHPHPKLAVLVLCPTPHPTHTRCAAVQRPWYLLHVQCFVRLDPDHCIPCATRMTSLWPPKYKHVASKCSCG